MLKKISALLFLTFCIQSAAFAADDIRIHYAFVDSALPENQQSILRDFLISEINHRIQNQVQMIDSPDQTEGVVFLVSSDFSNWPDGLKTSLQNSPLPNHAESYRILTDQNRVYIQGNDFRGLLFGMGHFLRKLSYNNWAEWKPQDLSSTPDKPIRGHQIGYRNTANSYDAWSVNQYEQYIRDMIVFGANSIENIPDASEHSPHFSLSNPEMNIELSRLSQKYQLDYWIWTPIQVDLKNEDESEEYLQDQEKLYRQMPKLDDVFVPGGDPGDNPPERVLPMMEKMAKILRKYHPEAKMWLSLQGFDDQASQFVYDYLKREKPEWMEGLVAGPSSPRMDSSRAALPIRYKMRHYPDITHTVRCQYPNWWWDPVYNFTLGREPVNPQPLRYQNIYMHTELYNDGFVSYSDGIHDDLNKMIWSQLGWNPDANIYSVVQDYANYFLSSNQSAPITDGLFALEKNWDGAIKYNGTVPGTLKLWAGVDSEDIYKSDKNWRWKMYLLRAHYDSFVRDRFIYEEKLEKHANSVLKKSDELGSEAAIDSVKSILSASSSHFKNDGRRVRIYDLAEALFDEIGYQTSVEKYNAKNPERGAILDFVDRPLNNTWWLESEFKRIESWSEERKLKRLKEIGNWENPGKGGFYDDIGNIYKSSHVIKTHASENDPFFFMSDNPGFDWWEEGYSKARLSWMSSMQWPEMVYNNLDSTGQYVIRMTGVGQFYTVADGEDLRPVSDRKETGEIVEVTVPQHLTKDGKLHLTWKEIDESHLNWRKHSRLNEIWLIKK